MSRFLLPLICLFFLACENQASKSEPQKGSSKAIISDRYRITCTDTSCSGSYAGPEFINGADIAHQFSNKMSAEVGNKLKALFDKQKYSKVNFDNIEMSTKGMGTGNVVFELKIPFVLVNEKCEAFTSFDHVGGWNHAPALERRKKELSKALLQGEEFNISKLKRTPEGLQEYWMQWKHKEMQFDCVR